MKILAIVCRVLLGLVFAVFGFNHLVPYMHPAPPPPASLPGQFLAVFIPTGWMFVVGLFEVAGGILLLIGGTAPLGIAILAPVIVNIILYTFCIGGGQGASLIAVLGLLEAVLLYLYRGYFASLFTTKAQIS